MWEGNVFSRVCVCQSVYEREGFLYRAPTPVSLSRCLLPTHRHVPFVHYVVRAVGKWVFRIRLKGLLVQ